jgi:hypothetical protein
MDKNKYLEACELRAGDFEEVCEKIRLLTEDQEALERFVSLSLDYARTVLNLRKVSLYAAINYGITLFGFPSLEKSGKNYCFVIGFLGGKLKTKTYPGEFFHFGVFSGIDSKNFGR